MSALPSHAQKSVAAELDPLDVLGGARAAAKLAQRRERPWGGAREHTVGVSGTVERPFPAAAGAAEFVVGGAGAGQLSLDLVHDRGARLGGRVGARRGSDDEGGQGPGHEVSLCRIVRGASGCCP